MKKIVFGICSMMLALTFASCNKVEDPSSQKITELRFNVQVENATALDTKAVKTAWADGDEIYVFFNGLKAMKYVTLTYDEAGGTWTGAISAESELDASDLSASGTMYGIHFPFGAIAITEDPSDSDGVVFRSSGNTNTALNGRPVYTYYLTGNTSYTVVVADGIGTLTGSFNLTMPDDYVWFFIDKSGTDYNANEKYRLSVDGMKPTACLGFSGGTFTETSLSAGQPVWGYVFDDSGIAFTGKVDDTWASSADHQFIFFSDGDAAMSRTITGALDVSGSKHPSVKLKAPTTTNGWTQAIPTPSTVDFGTATCLWADRNLGAASGMVPGMYLGWGQLVPTNDYTYNNWYPEGTADIKCDLTGDYAIFDAARAYLGADWRLPTMTEADDLCQNTTSQYDMDLDYVVLEKSEHSVCLPITNYYKENDPTGGDEDTGYFWLSTFYVTGLQASPYYFYVDRYYEETDYYYFPQYKDRAFTIRPVKVK